MAALEQTHRANDSESGGFFSSDTAGASLFDPNAYASYGNASYGQSREEESNAESTLNVPHGPEIPDNTFFENPPPAPNAPLEYSSGCDGDWNRGQGFANNSFVSSGTANASSSSFDWNAPSENAPSRETGSAQQQQHTYYWSLPSDESYGAA